MDHKSEEVSKGLFARICIEVDVSKPLKRKLKYFYVGSIHECLLDYENITNHINLIHVLLSQKALPLELKSFRKHLRQMTPCNSRSRIKLNPKMLIGLRSVCVVSLRPFAIQVRTLISLIKKGML